MVVLELLAVLVWAAGLVALHGALAGEGHEPAAAAARGRAGGRRPGHPVARDGRVFAAARPMWGPPPYRRIVPAATGLPLPAARRTASGFPGV